MSHVHAFSMHTFFLFIIFAIIVAAWDFSDCLFLFLPLFLFTLVVSMASKHKSIPARNPLRSDASSSSDPSPPNVLLDFADTGIPSIIHSRGWESLCDVSVTCPLVLIQEFYFNMHRINRSVPLFFTRVRGMRIPVTTQLVADVLRVSRIEFPDYPGCECLRTVCRDELMSAFVSALLLGVSVCLHHVDLLLKVQDSLTW